MKIKLSELIEGWGNTLFLTEAVEKVAVERLSICAECPHNSKNKVTTKKYFMDTCTLCNCPLKAKTRCLSCKCPDVPARWEAETTEDERWAIEDKIKKGENEDQSHTEGTEPA